MPATAYILQRPCGGQMLGIEAIGVDGPPGALDIERCSDRLVLARYAGISWIHATQLVPQIPESGVFRRCMSAFDEMRRTLASVGVRFDQIVRTWLYLGDIVGPEGETQRYKELNRARTDYFRDCRFGEGRAPAGLNGSVFPASTGIGADNRDIVMSCVAMATDRPDVMVVPLENPLQTSAFRYADCYSPKSPKFSRALAVASQEWAITFVSGTASITQSETRFEGDVEAQTRQTLDNIEALIAEDNLRRHGLPGFGANLPELALARVYVKPGEDYRKVQAICEARMPNVPRVYAFADVCRPELLVEIEGIVFANRGTIPSSHSPHFGRSTPTARSVR